MFVFVNMPNCYLIMKHFLLLVSLLMATLNLSAQNADHLSDYINTSIGAPPK